MENRTTTHSAEELADQLIRMANSMESTIEEATNATRQETETDSP